MRTLIIVLALLTCLPSLHADSPLETLKGTVADLILKPKARGPIPEMVLAMDFLLGSVEQAAHWAGRKAHQGNQAELAKFEGELARFDELMGQIHQQVLYGLKDRQKRGKAVDILVEARLVLNERLQAVIDKAMTPNDQQARQGYDKACRRYADLMKDLVALLR
jgi:hypothetical protein